MKSLPLGCRGRRSRGGRLVTSKKIVIHAHGLIGLIQPYEEPFEAIRIPSRERPPGPMTKQADCLTEGGRPSFRYSASSGVVAAINRQEQNADEHCEWLTFVIIRGLCSQLIVDASVVLGIPTRTSVREVERLFETPSASPSSIVEYPTSSFLNPLACACTSFLPAPSSWRDSAKSPSVPATSIEYSRPALASSICQLVTRSPSAGSR